MEKITTFINIQSDFGFKHVFGTLKNKAALIAFLNALFEGSLTVTDVKYHDKEILPSEQKGKRIIYDVYCTQSINRTNSAFFPESQKSGEKASQETDHHFILEMQNIYTPPFEERLAYYASRMVAGQGKAGWNYERGDAYRQAPHPAVLAKGGAQEMGRLPNRTRESVVYNKKHGYNGYDINNIQGRGILRNIRGGTQQPLDQGRDGGLQPVAGEAS